MKTLPTLLILISLNCYSQAFLTFTPEHSKIGIMYNVYPEYSCYFGAYTRIDLGLVKRYEFRAQELKTAAGISYNFGSGVVVVGINNTRFLHVNNDNPNIDLTRVHKYSIEIGFIKKLDKIFTKLLYHKK